MAKFEHDHIVPFQHSELDKKQQVSKMFDSIAFKYDFLNHFLSCGIDVIWRKKAISQLQSLNPQSILDVATGTGDVAIMSYRTLKPLHITGIDISDGMLQIGKEKVAKLGLENVITLLQGDSEALPFSDNSFDAITVAFGVRNFQNLEKGLSEMLRVLKPNGKLVILEFSKPEHFLFKHIYNFYMNIVTPSIGKLFSRNKDAYQYLNDSVQAFPQREQLTKVMKNTGYTNTLYQPLTFGICCIYCGNK